MTMGEILIVAKKEMKGIIKTKSQIILGTLFALWFTAISALIIKTMEESVVLDYFNNLVFYNVPMVGILVAYILSGTVFLNEKREGSIETLLCTPLSLRQIWSGKVMGVTILAYMIALMSAILLTILANFLSTLLLLPSPAILVHILLVVPVFISAFIGLLGFGQSILGMRENQIINIFIFLLIFLTIPFTKNVVGAEFAVSWTGVGVLLIISVLLLALASYLTRYLSKERIVTTIP